MARILAVRFNSCPGPDRGGVEGEQLLAALGPRHVVDGLVIRDGEQPLFEPLRHARLVRVPLPQAPRGEQEAAFGRAAARQLGAEEYDLVWLSSLAGPIVEPLVAALPPEVPLVLEPAAGEIAGLERGPWAARAAAVVVRTEVAAAALPSSLAGRAVVAGVGVDVDRFDEGDGPPAGSARLVVCNRGGLAGRGGLRRLAEATARLGGALRLLVPGTVDAGTRDALEALAPGAIEWPGPIPPEEMPFVHAASLGAVSAAPLDERTGPPLTLLEAMACGRIALAAAGPTAAHLLDDGRAGVLLAAQHFAPDGEVEPLAAALARLLDGGADRAGLAAAGRSRVRDHFTASARRRRLGALAHRLLR